MHLFFGAGLMVAILENGCFPDFATNFRIPPSRFLKLEVFHTQINCQSLCGQKCIRGSMPGPGLSGSFEYVKFELN